MTLVRAAWADFVSANKATAASITDALASVGERMPGVAQVTLSAGGATVTVTPKPPPPRPCSLRLRAGPGARRPQ